MALCLCKRCRFCTHAVLVDGMVCDSCWEKKCTPYAGKVINPPYLTKAQRDRHHKGFLGGDSGVSA